MNFKKPRLSSIGVSSLVADKAGVTGVGAAKVTGISVTCLTLPHLHGVLAVARNPVFAEDGGILALGHVEVTGGTEFPFREIMAIVAGAERVDGMAEEDVVGLLLVDFPGHLLARLDVLVVKYPFGLAGAEHLRMADRAVPGGRKPGKGSVGAQIVTGRTLHRGVLQVRLMAELHRLRLFAEQEIGKKPPAKHECGDDAQNERCGTASEFRQPAGLLVGRRVVLPILHTLRLLKWLRC